MESAMVVDEEQSFTDVVLTCEKVMAKQESIEFGSHTARQRRAELYLPALNGISRVLGAQATALMLLDDTNEELYTEAIVGDLPKHKNKLGEGIAGKCAVQGRILNVQRNATQEMNTNATFDKERHDDYLGSGTMVRSELCVPMFNSGRKCLGVIKVINKQCGGHFDDEDITFVMEVANNLAIMLEDDGGIKRVLAMTRQQMQHREATMGEKGDHRTVLCCLDRGQNLPGNPERHGVGIDPYVTINIVRGNPQNSLEMEAIALKERHLDKTKVVRRFGKTKTVLQSLNPTWDETLAVKVPIELRGAAEDELFAHVHLWDYDALKTDHLVGQAVFPLSKMPKGKLKTVKPHHVQPIPGVDTYDLERSVIWLSFSRAGPKPLAQALRPPATRDIADDWAGDNYVPKVGKPAAETFESTNEWSELVDVVRDSLQNTCGANFDAIERHRRSSRKKSGDTLVAWSVSDPEQVDCPLVYVSTGFEELSGYPRSYSLGRNCRFLQPNNRKDNELSNIEDRERIRNFVQGLMPEKHVLWTLVLNETCEGRKFWNLLRMEFVHLGDEKKPYIFAVQRELRHAAKNMQEVAMLRAQIAAHEKAGTMPTDVLEQVCGTIQ
jgi:putative methionine-R-sulfoxide reductase with GAF domain